MPEIIRVVHVADVNPVVLTSPDIRRNATPIELGDRGQGCNARRIQQPQNLGAISSTQLAAFEACVA